MFFQNKLRRKSGKYVILVIRAEPDRRTERRLPFSSDEYAKR